MGQRWGAEGAEEGSMFLKQLDNLFGLGPLPQRHGNDETLERGRRGTGGGGVEEHDRETDGEERWSRRG